MNPSPENPVEIESFECTKILITGRNIFNPKEIGDDHTSGTTYGVKCEALGDGMFRISGSATSDNQFSFSKHNYVPIKLKPGMLHLRQEEPANPKAYVDFFDKDKKWITLIQVNGTNTGSDQAITKEQADKIKYAMPCLIRGTGSTVIPGTIRPYMYQDGEDVYEPYFGKSQTLNITLRSLPDGTCDEYRDGKIIRRVGSKIFDGSSDEAWTARTDGRGYAIVVSDALLKAARNPVYCNRGVFSYAEITDKGIVVLGGSRTISFFMGGEQLDVTSWRNWLSTHTLEVLYPVNTPVIEEAAIPILPSQHPYTQVYTDSPIDTDIEWEILTSSNNDAQIEELLARVSALESEAVNAQN